MKLILTCTLLALLLRAYPQPPDLRGEFATNTNGLMYSEADMRHLRHTVDSLHLRFRTCDLSKTFYSPLQIRARYVSFTSEKNNLKAVISAIQAGYSYDSLLKKFSGLVDVSIPNQLVIRMGRDEDGNYNYLEGTPADGYEEFSIDNKQLPGSNQLPKGWVYDYSPKGEYKSSYSLYCRFFPGNWQAPAIPAQYSNLIQYVDCMIDTAATVYLTTKFSGGGWFSESEKPGYEDLSAIIAYIDNKRGQNNTGVVKKKLTDADISYAEKELATDETYRALLGKTIDRYAQNKSFNHQLESLALNAGLYDKALLMKRCYRIMGSCSQDTRPREHARDIAMLAARSHSWDIFLRAHLDIMNDRFARATDGSYAWGKRMTYLKELEELDLNITDLMLGLTMRASNVADNHYYGSISRLGRALAESREKEKFEQKAIAMMKDHELDEFNRGLVFLLYSIYTGYLDENTGKQKREALKNTMHEYPDFIQAAIQKLDQQEKRKRRG